MRLDSIFARNVGAHYRSTPQSPRVALAANDRARGNAVLQSSWDTDVVKRVAKDTLGNKASTFSGSEPHRQLLWDSLVTALGASFINKESTNEDIFDLVDVDKEIHPIYNDILLRSLVSLTTPHSPARRNISPRGHRPLRHHEELLGISFGSSDDPEPLVAQFDECIKAIAASGVGTLDDKAAKRQLLAALDGGDQHDMKDFLEEFARIVGEAASLLASLRHEENGNERDAPPPRGDFPRRHGAGGVKFPPSKWRDDRNRRPDGKFHGRDRRVGFKYRFAASPLTKGGNWSQSRSTQAARCISFHSASSAFVQECPLCPGHFHDTARCPTVCGSCDVDLRDAAMDMDLVVAAFQTAFDNENDGEFAELCHQLDRPLVRDDPEPFTYPTGHDVGLRAHYAGLGRATSDTGMGEVLADARGVLASLRSAAAAAEVVGAVTAGMQAPLHLGTLSVPQVVCDVPPPANHEIETQPLYPVLPSDPAAHRSPFEEPLKVTFIDRFHPACPDNPSLNLCSIEFAEGQAHPVELSMIDDDTDSDIFSSHGDEIPLAPPATRSRVSVATLPGVFFVASLALPTLMCLACVSAVQGSVVLDRAPDFTAAVHPTGMTANSLSALPYTFTFGIPFPYVVSADLDSDFHFSGFLNLLYESCSGFGFWSWLLDSGSGIRLWTLASGRLCWTMASGL
ncbi:hypothetical protein CYMTET_32563 [Cymbomonas tetramitiformis]|uniref:Uncharacterized protein n=1 Tax=Cymbomonas tetramitiformis TaxID=36881 RepID=A0AAE0FET3_9CHLO|nr:hypothetical protein CYMTET_32563 [Cymbomonas tetramitiformis]